VGGLLKSDYKNHILMRALDPSLVTPLAEEALYWDIRLPQGQSSVSQETAQAIVEIHQAIENLPKKAHRQDAPMIFRGLELGHAVRVAIYSALLAQRLSKESPTVLSAPVAAQSGYCHDLGKVQPVINEIVRGSKKPSEAEKRQIELHPQFGVLLWNTISHNGWIEMDEERQRTIHDGILHHHVRLDQKGYPYFIPPRDQSLIGRMIAIADSFDAMTSRPSQSMGVDRVAYAYEELKRCSQIPWDSSVNPKEEAEAQFDPRLVKRFLEIHPEPVFKKSE
jgi:HD-GYP domain-containing protein (c-di-GMP phosphodiesterase class II)